MKVILLASPRASGDIERHGLPFLSIGYVASSLLLDGHDVSIIDAHNFALSPEEAATKVAASSPDIVGIFANTHNRFAAIETIKLIRQNNPAIKIMAGGPHFGLTAIDAMTVVPAIDFVVKGEGEMTARELLQTDLQPGRLADILGLVYRDAAGMIKENADRPFVKDLDALPMPAWHLFGLENYPGSTAIEPTKLKTIGIVSSRGCPNRCIFCASIALHKGCLRLRSPKNFVDEIQHLHDNYGYSAFNFWDDTFSIVRQHAVDICNEIINRGLKIYWYTPCRVNTVDKELLELMKKAGCVKVNFGIESGSPRMLQIIKKGITMEQARAAVKASIEVGLEVTLNFLLVYPYETWDDIRQTVEAIKEFRAMPKVQPSHSFIIIYPGTELETIAKKEGIMPADFSWNSPYENSKSIIAGEDSSVFYFQWPALPFEAVKAYTASQLNSREDLYRKAWKKIVQARKPEEFMAMAKMGANYLKNLIITKR